MLLRVAISVPWPSVSIAPPSLTKPARVNGTPDVRRDPTGHQRVLRVGLLVTPAVEVQADGIEAPGAVDAEHRASVTHPAVVDRDPSITAPPSRMPPRLGDAAAIRAHDHRLVLRDRLARPAQCRPARRRAQIPRSPCYPATPSRSARAAPSQAARGSPIGQRSPLLDPQRRPTRQPRPRSPPRRATRAARAVPTSVPESPLLPTHGPATLGVTLGERLPTAAGGHGRRPRHRLKLSTRQPHSRIVGGPVTARLLASKQRPMPPSATAVNGAADGGGGGGAEGDGDGGVCPFLLPARG